MGSIVRHDPRLASRHMNHGQIGHVEHTSKSSIWCTSAQTIDLKRRKKQLATYIYIHTYIYIYIMWLTSKKKTATQPSKAGCAAPAQKLQVVILQLGAGAGKIPLIHLKKTWILVAELWEWFGYGSIPINTIFRGMNIHLPAILMFTRGTRFWHTAISLKAFATQVPWFVQSIGVHSR